MSFKNIVFSKVDSLYPAMVLQRRDIHQHPETGWTEFRTAAHVVEVLTELGYEVQCGAEAVAEAAMMGIPSAEALQTAMDRAISEGANAEIVAKLQGGKTGVAATLRFAKPGPVVGIRFDMDCNDVTETCAVNHRPLTEGFASIHAKEMHACGHDGHTTVGLALARIFAELKDELAGTIKLIFQPAEEGVRGAHAMVEAGVVDDVNYMLGAHFGFKMHKTGSIACDVTGFLATSKYDARFTGRPAHAGAAPEQGKNALLAAACATLNLHAIARHSEGASRINVGKLEAGSGRNVIGDKAFIALETRGASSKINAYMEAETARVLKAAAAMYDVEVEITKTGGAAGGSNSPALASYLNETAQRSGLFDTISDTCDFGASEDFSYFMERVQERGGEAAYMMIGADLAAGHHDSHFDFDEKALGLSAKMLALSAIGLLNKEVQA